MTNGVCPNCGAKEIYTDANIDKRFTGGAVQNLLLAKGSLVAPAFVRYNKYLCAVCGYLERYVTAPYDLQLLTENWTRVSPD